MSAISFIIINYNTYGYVLNLVSTLKKFFKNTIYEIILVDNNSTENDIENITSIFKDIRYFRMKENVGFSQANNFAVKQSTYPLLGFLNPDIILTEDNVSKLIRFVTRNENAGAVAPLLLNEDSSIQTSFGKSLTLPVEFLEAFYLINLYRRVYLSFRLRKKNKPLEVDWVSAAFLIIRKEHFENVNGFDSDFFLNYEDIEFCKRLNLKGLRNYILPYTECVHLGQSSFKGNIESLIVTRYQSRLVYWWKYRSLIVTKCLIILHLSGIIARLMVLSMFFSSQGYERRMAYIKSFKLLFSNLFKSKK